MDLALVNDEESDERCIEKCMNLALVNDEESSNAPRVLNNLKN